MQNGHSKEIERVRFSPSGLNVFSVGGDEKLKIYNTDGYLLKTFNQFQDEYLDGVFSGDGQKLYVTSFQQDSVYRIDMKTLDVDQSVPITTGDSRFQIQGLALGDDGTGVMVLISDKDYESENADFKIVEIEGDGSFETIKEGSFLGDDYGCMLGPVGRRLIHYPYVDEQMKTVLFNIETNSVIREFSKKRAFKFTSDEEEIYEVTLPEGDELAQLKFYETATGQESRTAKLVLSGDSRFDLSFKHVQEVIYFKSIQTYVAKIDLQYEGSRLLFFNSKGELQHETKHGLYAITAMDLSPATNRLMVCTGSAGQNIPNQMQFMYYDDFVSAEIKRLNDVSEAFQISFSDDSRSFVVSRKNGWSKIDLHGNVLAQAPNFSVPYLTRSYGGSYLLSTAYNSIFQHTEDGKLIKKYKLDNDPVFLASDEESDIVLAVCHKYIYGIDTKKREVIFERSYEDFYEQTKKYLESAVVLNNQFYLFSSKMLNIIDYKGNVVAEQNYNDIVISNFMAIQPMGSSGETEAIIGMPFSSDLYVFGTNGEVKNKIYLPWVDMKTNSVSASIMSADGQHYALGSSIGKLRILDEDGNLLHLMAAHANGVSAMAYSPDGKYLATGSIDGDIVLWDVENDYQKVMTYYVFEDGQFLVITPEGYYHASKDALDKFIYFKDGKIYRFDNYDLKFNRPDIIMDKLSLMDEGIIKEYRKAYRKRLSRAGVSDNALTAKFENLPTINLPETKYYQKVKSAEFSFDIMAESTDSPLSKLFVYVNGSPLYGIDGKDLGSLNTRVLKESCTFQLNDGRNLVSVSVLDKSGVESLKQKFIVDYNRSYQPTLHLIIVGVSEFEDQSMNLTYAAKDANDLKKQFKSSRGIYAKTKIYDLTNKNATKVNVLKELNALKTIDPDDAVIIHISSHGVLDADMDYYLAMHDMDFSNPEDRGLPYDLLEQEISKLPSRKKVLMLDACHSGELDKEEFEVSSNTIYTDKGEVKFRSVGSRVNPNSIGFSNSLELSKRIFSDMRRSSGTLVLSSAGAVEYAMESDEWKNGVFTFAILQGLQEGEADLNEDGEITFSELQTYVIDQVDILTEGGQRPNIRTSNEYSEEVRIW